MKRSGFWVTAAAVVALDQWTKSLVMAHLPLQHPRPLVPGVLWLTHIRNPGVAFGQLAGAGILLTLAALVAVVLIVAYRARRLRRGEELHPLLALGLALPLGGAIGNMIDRIRFGTVTDFLDLGWFPVFNIADAAITLGAGSLLIYFLFVQPREEPYAAAAPSSPPAPGPGEPAA